MALIKDIKRTASVFSTKTSLIFVLQSPSIDHLIQANPTFRNELTKLSNKRLGQSMKIVLLIFKIIILKIKFFFQKKTHQKSQQLNQTSL